MPSHASEMIRSDSDQMQQAHRAPLAHTCLLYPPCPPAASMSERAASWSKARCAIYKARCCAHTRMLRQTRRLPMGQPPGAMRYTPGLQLTWKNGDIYKGQPGAAMADF